MKSRDVVRRYLFTAHVVDLKELDSVCHLLRVSL